MDTRYRLHIAPEDAGSGAVPKVKDRSPLMLLFVTLMILGIALPLLATLPQTLDATASPAAAAVSVLRGMPMGDRPFHDRYPLQATTSWEDSLEQTE